MKINNEFTDVVDLNHKWVTEYRIPIVSDYKADYYYPVSLAVPSDREVFHLDTFVFPTEEEVILLSAYKEYRMGTLRSSYLNNVVRKDILDIDNGVNTHSFGKSVEFGWRYRKATWEHGAWPFADSELRYPNLIGLLGHIEGESYSNGAGPRWLAWKDENAKLISDAENAPATA